MKANRIKQILASIVAAATLIGNTPVYVLGEEAASLYESPQTTYPCSVRLLIGDKIAAYQSSESNENNETADMDEQNDPNVAKDSSTVIRITKDKLFFSNEEGEVIEPSFNNEQTCFVFDELYYGATISYHYLEDETAPVIGTFVLGDDLVIETILEKEELEEDDLEDEKIDEEDPSDASENSDDEDTDLTPDQDSSDHSLQLTDISIGVFESYDLTNAIFVNGETVDDFTAHITEGDAVTIDDTTITGIKEGSSTIRITIPVDDGEKELEGDLHISVGLYDLGSLSADDFILDETSIPYNGQSSFSLTGTLSPDILPTEDTVRVSFDVHLSSLHAGECSSSIDKITILEGADKYHFWIPEGALGPMVNIIPKEITLHASGLTVTYASKDWECLMNGTIPESIDPASLISSSTALNEAESNELSQLALSDYASISVTPFDFVPGTYPGAITLTITNSDDQLFQFNNGDTGTINVLKADLGEISMQDVDWYASDGAYQVGDYVEINGAIHRGVYANDSLMIRGKFLVTEVDRNGARTVLESYEISSGADKYDLTVSTGESGPVLTAARTDLGTLSADDFVFDDTTITYNGTDTISLNGRLKEGKGQDEEDTVSITAQVKIDDLKGGPCQSTIKSFSVTSGLDRYTFLLENGSKGPVITVLPREISLALHDYVTTYGSTEWHDLRNGKTPQDLQIKDLLYVEDALDDIQREAFEEMDLSSLTSIQVNKETYSVGTAADTVSVSLNAPADSLFTFASNTILGNVVVNAQTLPSDKEAWGCVAFDPDNSQKAYIRNDVLYIAPGGRAYLKTQSQITTYDAVRVRRTSPKKDDSYTDQIMIPQDAKEGSVAGDFYLMDAASSSRTDADERARGMQDNHIPSGAVMIDASAPIVTFSDGTYGSIGNNTSLSSIRVAAFKNGFFRVKSSITDELSGVRTSSYVYLFAKDLTSLQNAVNAALDGTSAWKAIPAEGVPVRHASDGYGICLIRAEDYVGNTSITASYVYVSDQSAPKITLTNIDESTIYAAPIDFTLQVDDDLSGLARITVSASSAGRVYDIYKSAFNEGENNLKNLAKNTRLSLTLPDELNDNDIVLTVTAEDLCGSTVSETKHVAVDRTAPLITVSYDRNDPVNEKYFSSARTMTVMIKERNFDPAKIMVDLSIGDDQTTTSLDAITGEGIFLESVTDSEEKLSQSDYTDDRTIVYRYSFGKSGDIEQDYGVSITGTDIPGNSAILDYGNSNPRNNFTIDEVAPRFTFTAQNGAAKEITLSSSQNAPLYEKQSFKTSILVKDHNTYADSVSLFVKGYLASGEEVVSDVGAEWNGDHNGGHYETSLISREANYVIQGTITDLAGNRSTISPYYVTIDRTAPKGSVSLRSDSGTDTSSSFTNKGSFTLFSRAAASASASASDAVSGISDISYYVYTPADDAAGSFSLLDEASLADLSWTHYDNRITFNGDSQQFVYVRMEDKAGNVSYINTEHGVIIDGTSPYAPSILIQAARDSSGIYNSDVPFSIDVEDPVNGGTWSGLRDVTWSVSSGGRTTQSGSYSRDLSEPTARVQSLSKSESVDASVNDSNVVTISVTATDWSGNTSSASKTIAIDVTAPIVSVSYDKNDPLNGRYFNAARTMTVTVRERNFDPQRLMVRMKIGDSEQEVSLGTLTGSGITLVSHTDSQSGSQSASYTNDRLNTYVFVFGASSGIDEDYNLSFRCEDAAGNSAGAIDFGNSNPAANFTIDKVVPLIDFSLAGGDGTNSDGSYDRSTPYYDRTSITVSIRVTERNFSTNGLSLTLTGYDAVGNPVNTSTSGHWLETGKEHTYVLDTFAQDGNYALSATFVDLAGNKTVSDEIYFTVDKTNPTGLLTVKADVQEASSDQYHASARFSLFAKESSRISLQTDDATSGVAGAWYYLYQPPAAMRYTFGGLSVSALQNVEWKTWPGELILGGDAQYIVYVRIRDRAGNISYISTLDSPLIDHTAPQTIQITLDGEPSEKGIYNQDVPFTIRVTDPEEGGTYAGLKQVSWSVTADGKETQSGSYDMELTDNTARIQTLLHNETVLTAENNTNDVVITVSATDYAGNVAVKALNLQIDTSKPIVTVTYDNNEVENSAYYKNARTATIRVSERNFDEDGVVIAAIGQNGKKGAIGKWQKVNDALHLITVTFAQDDAYSLNVKAIDAAGNEASFERSDHFVIDKEKPLISVSYDNDAASNDRYFSQGRTATIVINDANVSLDDIEIIPLSEDELNALKEEEKEKKKQRDASVTTSVKSSDPTTSERTSPASVMPETSKLTKATETVDPNVSPAPSKEPAEATANDITYTISNWEEELGEKKATISFTQDGAYAYVIRVKDLAGNEADPYIQDRFIIDTQSPLIIFDGVEDHSANRGVVTPEIQIDDTNIDPNSLRISCSRSSGDTFSPSGQTSVSDGSIVFTMDDIEHIQENDDLYTLQVDAADNAGNTITDSLSFSVNRFGSVYSLDDKTRELVDSYYIREGKSVTLYETNVDRLEEKELFLARDGEVTALKEGDYSEEDVSAKDKWTRVAYTFNASLFAEEGLYELLVRSRDAAGNKQDNAMKETPVRFVIDKSAPHISISGIRNNAQYTKTSVPFTVNVTDNQKLKHAVIRVNDAIAKDISGDELTNSNGVITAELSASSSWQTVTVTAFDEAGNEAEEVNYRIFVNTNYLLQLFANRPLLIALCLLLVAGIGLFVYRKKRIV